MPAPGAHQRAAAVCGDHQRRVHASALGKVQAHRRVAWCDPHHGRRWQMAEPGRSLGRRVEGRNQGRVGDVRAEVCKAQLGGLKQDLGSPQQVAAIIDDANGGQRRRRVPAQAPNPQVFEQRDARGQQGGGARVLGRARRIVGRRNQRDLAPERVERERAGKAGRPSSDDGNLNGVSHVGEIRFAHTFCTDLPPVQRARQAAFVAERLSEIEPTSSAS